MNTQTIAQTDALTARAALSTIIEPGDGVAGTLVDALGPVAAFEAITGNSLRAALRDAGVGERTASESIARWTPHISSSIIAANLAALEDAGVTLVDPDTIPALADLGVQRPLALYVRGEASCSPPRVRSLWWEPGQARGTENSLPARSCPTWPRTRSRSSVVPRTESMGPRTVPRSAQVSRPSPRWQAASPGRTLPGTRS